jgi:flagellar hook-basal body complex protein FliE
MNVSSISQTGFGKELQTSEVTEGVTSGPGSFFSDLKASIGEVNQLLAQSDKSASDLAVGKSENIHEAMIATEKAETALKYLIQVRNKALDAYREVMRMQL